MAPQFFPTQGGASFGLELRLPRAAPGGQFLGSIPVVERLVRSWAIGVLNNFDAVANGRKGLEAATAENAAAARKLADVLTGRVPGYAPMTGWTGAEQGQIRALRAKIEQVVSPAVIASEGVAYAAAGHLLDRIYAAASVFNRNGDEAAYKAAIMDVVDEGTRLFLGIPEQAEFERLIAIHEASKG